MRSGLVAGTLVLALIASALAGSAVAQDDAVEWTFMVYMSGDSSLSVNIAADIQEMKEVGSGDNLDIIVLSDSAGDGDTVLVRIIQGGQETISLSEVNSTWGSELDLGRPETLSQFVIWATENYPADRYVLDMWGHGVGWSGVCPDKGNSLDCREIGLAMDSISAAGIRLDLVSMDACQMGMVEVAYELRVAADYALLSEKDVPVDGWPYDDIFRRINDAPGASIQEFGSGAIEDYMTWGLVYSRYSLTLALVDLAEMEELAGAVDDFSTGARNMAAFFNVQYAAARAVTEEYDGNAEYDLWHLMENMGDETDCRALQALGGDVLAALDAAIVAERHWTHPQDEPADNAHGLSIWFPSYAPNYDYTQCGLSQDTGWDEFLAAMAPYFQSPGRVEAEYSASVDMLDSDSDGLADTISATFGPQTLGDASMEIYGPTGDLVQFSALSDTGGSETLRLETLGLYSAAFYLTGADGILRNYTLFEGLAVEGQAVISGKVLSELGRGLKWVQVTLEDPSGKVIASAVTDTSGHYRMEVVVPTQTDGVNLTLSCGLGESRTNVTIGSLTMDNAYDFRLDGSRDFIGWLGYAVTALNLAGILLLLAWGVSGRGKPDEPAHPWEKE